MSRPSSLAGLVTHLSCIVLALAAPVVCLACVQVGTGTDTGTGTTADGGTASSSDGSTMGLTGCGPDPATGVVLCLGTGACPNMTIDTTAFPSCGFHQGGASEFDLECICNGAELCPIGEPTTCAEVSQLLTQQQSALQVCQQVSTGGCLSLQDAGSGSGSGGTTGLSSACQTCVSSCGSTPACYQSCGC
jgi:hypothetical protein